MKMRDLDHPAVRADRLLGYVWVSEPEHYLDNDFPLRTPLLDDGSHLNESFDGRLSLNVKWPWGHGPNSIHHELGEDLYPFGTKNLLLTYPWISRDQQIQVLSRL